MFGVTFISPSLAPRSSLAGGEGVRLPSSGNLQNLPISVCLSHGANVSCLLARGQRTAGRQFGPQCTFCRNDSS